MQRGKRIRKRLIRAPGSARAWRGTAHSVSEEPCIVYGCVGGERDTHINFKVWVCIFLFSPSFLWPAQLARIAAATPPCWSLGPHLQQPGLVDAILSASRSRPPPCAQAARLCTIEPRIVRAGACGAGDEPGGGCQRGPLASRQAWASPRPPAPVNGAVAPAS